MPSRRKRLQDYDKKILGDQRICEKQPAEYPIGWYFARFSEDLKPGEVVPVEFMSRQFALFRGKTGKVGMIDSRCCHMGADLARSGQVSGDRLACGYHHWEFESNGHCAAIPRVPDDSISPRAKQLSVPLVERAGSIYFWYGHKPAREFIDLSYLDSSNFLNIKGKVYIGHGEPLSVVEHMVDAYHLPFSHRFTVPVQYEVLVNDGDRFEFRMQPTDDAQAGRINRIFKPYAFGEMASPTISIYRTQANLHINRTSPLLTILIGNTPIRDGIFIITWRIAVRKLGPDRYFAPLNYALSRLMFHIVRWHLHADMDVLRFTRSPVKPLSVKPDGQAVREIRAFYRRNIQPGWRFGAAPPEPETIAATGRTHPERSI